MLLGKPRFSQNECLISYLIRVSEINGFKHIGALLRHAGLTWQNNRAPVHQILTGQFDLAPYLSALDLPARHSKTEQIFHSFKRRTDTPYLLAKYPKVCPDCINLLGYCKYEWSFLPSIACTSHNKMLIDAHCATGKRLSWYRPHLKKFDSVEVIKAANDCAPPAAIQLSQYVESLLSGRTQQASVPKVLHGLELRESLSMINFIAHYKSRLIGGSFNPTSMENFNLARLYQAVWESLHDWPDSFYSLLSRYVDRPMSSKGISGINKHYRDLYERLHRQQENEGIARIKAGFDSYIGSHWPGLLEPERITRISLASTSRNVIAKCEVARILGSRLERIDKLVRQGKLTPVVLKGKVHYLRDQAQPLANTIAANWSMAEASEALRLTRYQLKQLLDAGVLPAIQKPSRLNRDWIIDKVQGQKLVAYLRAKARKGQVLDKIYSMGGIQRKGFSFVQLINAMQIGSLSYGLSPEEENSSNFRQFIAFSFAGRLSQIESCSEADSVTAIS